MNKIYLMDGAYAELDEWGNLILTAENGIEATDRVILEETSIRILLAYLCRLDAGKQLLRDALGAA